jgi:hypothetical protein
LARARFFTIEEAARVLRIGRTAAYQGAKRYRETAGAEGLPVVVICGSLRVPGGWLEEMAGGPIDVDDLATLVASSDDPRAETPSTPSSAPRSRALKPKPSRATTNPQSSLPFTG